MSRLVIGSNIPALNAVNNLNKVSGRLSQNFERLSSGMRINRASDDPAGLALAESLKSEKRIFTQGVRNLNDGISLLSVADAALSELSNITGRILELAEQSANGTLSNNQRKSLDDEAQALRQEFTRIAQTTEFNGKKLFDGNFGDLRLQAGFGEAGGFSSGLGGAIGDGTFGNASTFGVGDAPVSVSTGDFNGDGVIDLVTADSDNDTVSVLLGNGDGTFGAASSFGVGVIPFSVTTGDFNGNGVLDLVTTDRNDNTVSVLLGNGDGTFGAATSFGVGNGPISVTTGDFNGDGVLDLVTADIFDNTASVLLGNGDGTFGAATSFGVGSNPTSVTTGDFNGDGALDLVTSDLTGNTVSVLLGNGDGTFGAATSFGVGSFPVSVATGDFNGDGVLDLLTPDQAVDSISILLGNGDGTFGSATSIGVGDSPASVTIGDFNGDGVLDLVAADRDDSTVSVLVGNSNKGVSALLNFSLKTKSDSLQAIGILQNKVDQLALHRGQVGAFESRTNFALSLTEMKALNSETAASKITDVDVAKETTELVTNQIIQQSAAFVLAQANLQPQLVLSLLSDDE